MRHLNCLKSAGTIGRKHLPALVIEPQLDAADSFSEGLAGVGMWLVKTGENQQMSQRAALKIA